jgi:hypothetical protein
MIAEGSFGLRQLFAIRHWLCQRLTGGWCEYGRAHETEDHQTAWQAGLG